MFGARHWGQDWLSVSTNLTVQGLHGVGLLGPWPPRQTLVLCVLGTCGWPCGLVLAQEVVAVWIQGPCTSRSTDPGPQAGGGIRLVASSAAFDLGAQQLVGGGASPPASCLLSLTAAHPEGQQATWCLLCVPFQCWGRGEGNKTTFGGTSKVQFSNQKEFPSFPLMFCLCVVLGFK